jgi:hypothetical protein
LNPFCVHGVSTEIPATSAHGERTLSAVGRITIQRQQAAERLALKIYCRANGEPITRRAVEAALAQWRAHPASCACGWWEPARKLNVSAVWPIVWGWQSSIARTRRLAQR